MLPPLSAERAGVRVPTLGTPLPLPLRRTPHAVYATLYHLVWPPKYRRDVLQGEVQRRVQEICVDIAEQYDLTIEEMTVFAKFGP